MQYGSSMACGTLAPPSVGTFAAGRVLLPAFCPSWTRSFVALSHQRQAGDYRRLRTAAASESPLIAPRARGALRARRRCVLSRITMLGILELVKGDEQAGVSCRAENTYAEQRHSNFNTRFF